MTKLKAIIIQNYLSPYRVSLFKEIASSESIDLMVVLLAPDKPSYPQWNYDFDRLPFRVKSIPGVRLVLSSNEKSQICFNPYLLKFLIDYKPDVIFCTGFGISTILVSFYSLFTKKPMIIWFEGTHITENKLHFSLIRNIVRKYLAILAGGFVVAGQLSREYITSLLANNIKKPIIISYNCVDSQALYRACQEFKKNASLWRDFRAIFPEKNILFSGQLIKRKGIYQTLEVYRRVCKNSPHEVGLILLGQGVLREFIQDYKNRNGLRYLFIEGFVGAGDYAKYFALADVFLLLSLWDCNPLVIFEALSCGLPIICSNRAGNAVDFVEEGKNGYVVDPYDYEGTARKVLSVLYCPEIDKMRSASREIVRRANYQDSAEAFIKIAKDVLL